MKNLSAVIVIALSTLTATASADAYYHDAQQLALSGIHTAWGVAHDSNYLYVSDWETDVIHKFDMNGVEVATLGGTGSGNSQFDGPKGLVVDETGKLYVCDAANGRVEILNADGSYVTEWSDPTAGATASFSPEDIAFGLNGEVFVSDSDNHRILVFDRQGNYLRSWGHLAFSGTDGFAWPEGLAVDGAGNVYVADSGNGRVLSYTPQGVFVRQYGSRGIGQGMFDSPMDVVVEADGQVFVTDNGGQRVQAFSAAGTFEFWWGQNDNGAYFQDLYGMTLGPDGRVLVADGMSGNIYSLTYGSQSASPSWAGGAVNARTSGKVAAATPEVFAVGPVPAAPGDTLCMTLSSAPTSGEWRIFSIDGRLIADLHFDGQTPQCWSGTRGLPKGLYFFQLTESWSDGHSEQRVQKVVLR